MDEDWTLLRSFFPDDWTELAVSAGALKGLRKNKSAESLLRTLLIHFGCGHPSDTDNFVTTLVW